MEPFDEESERAGRKPPRGLTTFAIVAVLVLVVIAVVLVHLAGGAPTHGR